MMHRPGNILLFCITAILAGCTANRATPAAIRENMRFNVAVTPNTRIAASSDKEYPDNVPFAVWAMDSGGKYLLDGVPSELNSEGLWQPEGGMLWPEGNPALVFLAASPFGRGLCDTEKGIVFEDYDLSEDIDLLYTDPVRFKNQSSAHGVVPLDFRHALATLRFSVRARITDGVSLTVRKIIIEGLATEGSFSSIPAAAWTCGKQDGVVTVFDGSAKLDENRTVLGEGTYQIPQSGIVRVKVVFDYKSGEVTVDGMQTDAEMQMILVSGKVSQYLITVTSGFDLDIEKDNS